MSSRSPWNVLTPPSAMAMTLRSDYHIVLGHKLNGPTEVPVDPFIYTIGSDGARPIACIRSILFIAKHVAAEYFKAVKAA